MELLLILSFIIIILIFIIILVKINEPIYIDDCNDGYKFSDFETGCKPTRYGCCNDNITTKLDTWGSNCYAS